MNFCQYDVLTGANEALVLRVAVPGLTKDRLQVDFTDDILIVKEVNKPPLDNYTRKGIKEIYGEWTVPDELKIDMVSLQNGILEVLFSKKLPETQKGTRLEIQ